jgi:effector-binding domain-containing protein
MKAFKKVLIGLGVIILLLVIISFFIRSSVIVERSIFIKTNVDVPFEQVNNFHNWGTWMPWNKIDSTMKKTYEGPETGVGAIYKWESNNKNVGVGSMHITKVVKDSVIEMVLAFKGENREAHSGFEFQKMTDSTKVSWYIIMNMGWNPVSKYFGLFMDKMMGPDFEKGLKDLKTVCETKPSCMNYKIEETEVKPFMFLSIRDTCSPATIGLKMGKYIGEIMAYMGKNGLLQTNPPIAIYHKYEGNIFDVEMGIPIDKIINFKDKKIKFTSFKGCKALVAQYFGPYEKIGDAHEMMMTRVSELGLKINGACWEEYVSDPATEKDPSKLLTKIYYPVE